jgi:hypothetical protein
MKKIKVYIAGPISGMPDYNRQAFADMADKLRRSGFDAVNPHETCSGIVADNDKDLWAKCMKADIKQLMDCDYIMLLPGWNKSKGCRIEIALCKELGIEELKNVTELALHQDM